ncbi:MAG: hypothetical protein DBY25_06520 [Clostridiales bacterium]|nr:MAG: hypothetical protein DBY25_06520 [Clostridiales bacterium]
MAPEGFGKIAETEKAGCFALNVRISNTTNRAETVRPHGGRRPLPRPFKTIRTSMINYWQYPFTSPKKRDKI